MSVIPSQKIGTPFQRPNWRFLAAENPRKFDLDEYLTEFDRGNKRCTALRRIRVREPDLERVTSLGNSPALSDFTSQLPADESIRLQSLVRQQFVTEHATTAQFRPFIRRPATATTAACMEVAISWNLKKLKLVGDDFFIRYIQHISGVETYPEFTYAVSFHKSPELKNMFELLGCLIYAGRSDAEIAKSWRVSVKKIEAARMLFFDFSHYPKDRISQCAFLQYMSANKIIGDGEYMTYRRIYDLGELGLKAKYDYLGLSDDDKAKLRKYLQESVISNTLMLANTVRSKKDVLNFSKAVMDIERLDIERENLKREEVTTQLRISQIKTREGTDLLEHDVTMFELVKKRSLAPPKELPVISIADLPKALESK